MDEDKENSVVKKNSTSETENSETAEAPVRISEPSENLTDPPTTEAVVQPEQNNQTEPSGSPIPENYNVASNICQKCGAIISPGQSYCPNCGTKVNDVDSKGKGIAKIVAPIIAAIVVVAIIVLAIVLTRSPSVEAVNITAKSLDMRIDEEEQLIYAIKPSDAKDTKVKWESSDADVAIVDADGNVTAINEGTCTVTITAGKETDEVEVIVRNGPNLKDLYDKYCISIWATIGSDNSYLTIDTNPFDKDDAGIAYYDAYEAIKNINAELGLPESVLNAMGSTTAIQGRQAETFEDIGINVSWTYHPDKGLVVTYEMIN